MENIVYRKIVYLTIDDGPSIDMKKKVDFLLFKKIPAVFFCRGDFLKKFSNYAEYAIMNGFIIGNHSYNHHRFSDLNLKMAFEEIKKTDEIIEKIYKKAGVLRPLRVFRFPYGDKGGINKKKIQDILLDLGYRQPKFQGITYDWYKNKGLHKDKDISWTYDIEEYKMDNRDMLFNRIKEFDPDNISSMLKASSNEILLVHDHVKTTEVFFKIIEKISQMKLEFRLPDCNLEYRTNIFAKCQNIIQNLKRNLISHR
ncbi:MAG: polysaccharide deacetylase family protein [bacterium]|nr:polysaccharide deacetylase family protein [bacterium]